jgi:hypothetical protein
VLKFIFLSLLGINVVLFAFGQGWLGNFKPSEREPARIARQLNTDKLQLLSAASAGALKAGPAPATDMPDPPAAQASVLVACTEIGSVNERDARRLDRLLAPLALGDKLTRSEVAVQEIGSYMVMIPPLGSKEAADARAAELKELGVTNYFIMNETSAAKWAISLGVFKAETAAQTLLAALGKQGVRGAKIVGRPVNATRLNYRLRDLEPAARARIDAIVSQFDGLDARSCK